jgi:two-component system, chemotaxis family, chemotaxis protein CheY
VADALRNHFMSELLVVDDSRVMREMIIACLRPLEAASFTQAASGLEAIEQLSLRAFDAVILDLNMPDVDGYEVIAFVRSQDRLKELPIVVVTTRSDDDSRSRALGAGASRFVTKPFSPEHILAEVRSLLRVGTAK